MKKILNEWQWWFEPLQNDYMTRDRGWKIFSCGVVKINTKPPEGVMLRQMDYDGFIIRFAYWLPIDRA